MVVFRILEAGLKTIRPLKNKKKEIDWTDQLAEELHKPITHKFTKRKVIVDGIDDIWSADLVDMQSFSQYNKGFKYLLNVIDVFSKYAWSIPLMDKTGKTITNAFERIVKTSKRKPNKLWVDQGSEFFNRTMDQWLKNNNIKRYNTYNEGKAVVVERFNRTLKTRMWKYFSANNSYNYIDVIDDLLWQYNNSRHRSIKMKPKEASLKKNEALVWRTLYDDLTPEVRNAKYRVGDNVRIAKKKATFEKGYTPNWTEEVFEITEVQNTNPVTYKLQDWNGDKIDGSFYKQELQKTSQDVFRIERILRRDNKNQRMFVKWMGYPDSFNSWVSMKYIDSID